MAKYLGSTKNKFIALMVLFLSCLLLGLLLGLLETSFQCQDNTLVVIFHNSQTIALFQVGHFLYK